MNPNESLNALIAQTTTQSSGAILVQGPCLVGKSKVIRDLKTRLDATAHDRYCHLGISAQNLMGYEPVLDAIDQLSKRRNWSKKKQGIFYAQKYGSSTVTFGARVVKKIFPDALSTETIDQLKKALDEVLKPSNESLATAAFPRSESSRVLDLLNKTINAAGRILILLVDQIEELPTPGVLLLRMLGELKPANFVLVLSASTENLGYVRPEITELINFVRRSGSVMDIAGFSADDLAAMKWRNSYYATLSEARAAYAYALDGRIGLLTEWLESSINSIETLVPAAGRLNAHYTIQFERLLPKAKELVKTLSWLYPDGISVAQTQSILDCNAEELEAAFKGVLQVFLVIVGRTVRLRSRHVWLFTKSTFNRAIVEHSFNSIVSTLGWDIKNSLDTSQSAVPSVATTDSYLRLPTSMMSLQQILAAAKDDLRRGASVGALQRLEAWRQWSREPVSPDIETELTRLEADALGQHGDYELAITKLQSIMLAGSGDPELSVELGEKQLRAGRHADALASLRTARRLAKSQEKPGVWVTAASRTLTIRNEVRAPQPSVQLAKLVVRVCDESRAKVSGKALSLGLRTGARSLAWTSDHSACAEDLANRALQVATELNGSRRDEGNCLYALGDVLRHAKQHHDATNAYLRSEQIAVDTGNYDLQLYALLGLAANSIATQDVLSLKDYLSKISLLTLNEGSDEFLIVQLFNLVYRKLSLMQLNESQVQPVKNRPWTLKLLKLASDVSTPKNSLASALIIL